MIVGSERGRVRTVPVTRILERQPNQPDCTAVDLSASGGAGRTLKAIEVSAKNTGAIFPPRFVITSPRLYNTR
jgi:hypothetical protein